MAISIQSEAGLTAVKKQLWVYDTEGDGFLEHTTRLYCAVFSSLDQTEWRIFTDMSELTEEFINMTNETLAPQWFDLSELSDWLLKSGEVLGIIAHNAFGHDLPVFEKLGYINDYHVNPGHIDGVEMKLFDTLPMSRLLNPNRPMPAGCPIKVFNQVTKEYNTIGPHGLASWGYRVANMKPTIDNWIGLPMWEYVNRCVEDVKINVGAWHYLCKEASKGAIGSAQGWAPSLRLATQAFFLFCEQERNGVPFDIKKAEALVVNCDNRMEKGAEFVEPQLPERTLPETQQPNFPAAPFTGDGSLSAHAWSYIRKLGYELDERAFSKIKAPANPFKANGDISAYGLKFMESEALKDADELRARMKEISSHNDIEPLQGDDLKAALKDIHDKKKIILTAPMRLANQKDIKEWLFSAAGWKPTVWGSKNVTVDAKKKARTKSEIEEKIGDYVDATKESVFQYAIYKELKMNFNTISRERAIERLERKARFLPTTPKFKDERGVMCPNLDRVEGPLALRIVKWLSTRNRRTSLKPLDPKKKTGMLNNPRLEIDGRLPARSSGLTNTTRQTHAGVVNIPKADPSVLLGKEMRELFYAPEGWYFQGVDGDAIEARVAGWYAQVVGGDGGAFARKVLGTEEGAIEYHQANANAYSEAAGILVSRSQGKNLTYGILYGAGAGKIASMLGVNNVVAQAVIDALWDSNPGLKLCKKKLEKHWEDTGKKYIRGIDGRKIYTRSKHSLLNCLFQSCGAIVMDMAGVLMDQKIREEGLQASYQRVLYVHDEYQLLVKKDQFEVKHFDTKDEAKDFSDPTGRVWSGISEDSNEAHEKDYNGPCTMYYSRVSEISAWAIEAAGEHFKSPVPITAGYDVGRNWSETH